MATADEPPPRTVITGRAFERDLKRLNKRGVDLEPLWVVVEALRLSGRRRHQGIVPQGKGRSNHRCTRINQ